MYLIPVFHGVENFGEGPGKPVAAGAAAAGVVALVDPALFHALICSPCKLAPRGKRGRGRAAG